MLPVEFSREAIRMLRRGLILLVGVVGMGASGASAAQCTGDHRPVCAFGKDGIRGDFPSACAAEGTGAAVLHPDACEAPGPGPSMCSHLYKPVCATEPTSGAAKTYPNLCTAEQANAPLVGARACSPAGAKGGG
jgi:hypothetical protein